MGKYMVTPCSLLSVNSVLGNVHFSVSNKTIKMSTHSVDYALFMVTVKWSGLSLSPAIDMNIEMLTLKG